MRTHASVSQSVLALPEPELTEKDLREAHRHCRILRPFDECRRVPWLWPLICLCARERQRRARRAGQ